MSSPRFSFAMPAYNAAGSISNAIDSVLAQGFEDWELVICNDGSTDDTLDIIKEYQANDQRIHVISQQNAGCGAARDTAVRASHAPWIVRLDADDRLFPTYLAKMNAFIEDEPGYDLYSCNGIHCYPDGSTRRARPGSFYDAVTSFTYEDMLFATHIFTIAIFSREIFDRIGGISPTAYCEDVDFWLRAFIAGATHRYTPDELAYYTVSENQMSADFPKIADSRARIYQACIDSGRLSPAQIDATKKALLRVRQDERMLARRTRFVGRLEGVLGKRPARWVSKGLHVFGKPIRAFQKRFPS